MKGDPFNFDIRASTDKKKRVKGRRGMSGAVETSARLCHQPGCTLAGQYRAPRAPDALDEYLWFCKEHAREYNLKWNFFSGQTEPEVLETLERDRIWGRSTDAFGAGREAQGWSRHGIDDPFQVLGEKATQRRAEATPRPGGTATRRLPAVERKALEILDARDTWSRLEIRKQYKSLVKDLHPDLNGGNRADEERLQEVVWAWDQIKESRSFGD